MSTSTKLTAAMMAAALAASGCATTSDQPLTVQQKIAGCVGMMVLGAALGAAIGNNVGDGDAGTGAGLGAGLGAGACAVWLAFENEEDKRRLAEMQMEAARTGQIQNAAWVGDDGRRREVSISPSVQTEMSVYGSGGATEQRLCRPLNTTASVNGQGDSMDQLWCRNPDGSYSPARAAA